MQPQAQTNDEEDVAGPGVSPPGPDPNAPDPDAVIPSGDIVPPSQPPANAQEAANREAAATEAEAQDYETRGQHEAEIQNIESGKLSDQGKSREQAVKELNDTMERQREDYAAATAKANAAQDEYKNFQFHDFFANKGTGAFISAILGGLGGFGAAVNGHNAALSAIDQAMTRDYNMQVQHLNSKEQLYKWQQEGVKDLDRRQSEEIDHLKLKYGYALDAIADKADSMAALQRAPLKQAEFQALADKTRAGAAHLQRQGFDESVKNDLMRSEIERNKASADAAEARAKKLGRHGAGGGGSSKAFSDFVDAAGALKPGEPITAEIADLGIKAGLKKNQVATEAAKYAGRNNPKGGPFDPNLVVRNGNGDEVGLAPSTRVVKQVEDRLIQYDDSIKSLEDLKAYVAANPILGRAPVGDAYNRAVLAVAATTTANASDKTTTHEANTIKNWGVVSADAIEKTLEHQKARQAAFLKQLRPMPGVANESPAPSGATDAQAASMAALKASGWK